MMPAFMKTCDLPKPVVASLTAMWDALNIVEAEISKAAQENSPAGPGLQWLQDEFKAARYDLVGFLLDTLAPHTDDLVCGTAEQATEASPGHMAIPVRVEPPARAVRPPGNGAGRASPASDSRNVRR